MISIWIVVALADFDFDFDVDTDADMVLVLVVAAYKEKKYFKTFTTKELPDAATITINRTRKVAIFIMNFDIKGKYK